MRKIILLLLSVTIILSVYAQFPATAVPNFFNTQGTAASNASIASTNPTTFKLSIQGNTILWGTNVNTATSPTLYFRNTSATGRIWALNSDNTGIFTISEATGTPPTLTHSNKFLINSAGNVGIGAASPTARLHVTTSGLLTATTNALLINNTGNTNLFTVLDNGNVGIGVAVPLQKLDVSGNVKFSSALMPNGDAGTVGMYLKSAGPNTPPTWASIISSGEANTASNVGTVGTGLFKLKNGANLEFYKLNPLNNKVTIALNGVDRIDLGVNEANFTAIPNSALTNSSITIGTTNILLGATTPTLAGLTSVTSATFVGALNGNATTATTATNLSGGLAGSIPYQSAASTTAMLGAGISGHVLTVNALGLPTWAAATTFSNNAWSTLGNTGTMPGTNFIGTIDDKDLVFKRNGIISGNIGTSNTSFGLYSNQQVNTGIGNTALGKFALKSNTADYNTAIGIESLVACSTGYRNSALGSFALGSNTTGYLNAALGYGTLQNNTIGNSNSAFGAYTLGANLSGIYNVGIGYSSMNSVTTGNSNVGIGTKTLNTITNGSNNTALGNYAGQSLVSGDNNIIIGYDINVPNLTGSNQLNIGNWIYGSVGNIGIGVSSPQEKLHVDGRVKIGLISDNPATTHIVTTDATGVLYKGLITDIAFWKKNTAITPNNPIYYDGPSSIGIGTNNPNSNTKLHIAGGNVFIDNKLYIGTTVPAAGVLNDYALAVNGNAIFNNAKVKLFGAWPDYVFENEFKLMPLDDLQKYIDTNKHLPNVPTANDVEKNAIDIGENQKILLQKVEELTLYILQLKKEIDLLKNKN
jgi:hypothetical protein